MGRRGVAHPSRAHRAGGRRTVQPGLARPPRLPRTQIPPRHRARLARPELPHHRAAAHGDGGDRPGPLASLDVHPHPALGARGDDRGVRDAARLCAARDHRGAGGAGGHKAQSPHFQPAARAFHLLFRASPGGLYHPPALADLAAARLHDRPPAQHLPRHVHPPRPAPGALHPERLALLDGAGRRGADHRGHPRLPPRHAAGDRARGAGRHREGHGDDRDGAWYPHRQIARHRAPAARSVGRQGGQFLALPAGGGAARQLAGHPRHPDRAFREHRGAAGRRLFHHLGLFADPAWCADCLHAARWARRPAADQPRPHDRGCRGGAHLGGRGRFRPQPAPRGPLGRRGAPAALPGGDQLRERHLHLSRLADQSAR